MRKRKTKSKLKKQTKCTCVRSATIKRETRETNISGRIAIDGKGNSKISTGIGFLDHMLELFTKHGLFDIDIHAKGDLKVDIHHTNEDVAISLGEAFANALGNRKGIKRFGFFYVPMGEALSRVVLDLSSRPNLMWNQAPLSGSLEESVGKSSYTLEDAKHFVESFAQKIRAEIWVDFTVGKDLHHTLEAIFKSLAKTLDQATQIDPRIKGVPSTKGML